jgi:nicotinamide-nucleotide amidase
MNCEIITIGSEILLGQIVDTNSSYLAKNLNRIGLYVAFHSTAGDNHHDMHQVLSHAMKRSDVVIITGGLGPTEDDLTREVIADLVGVPLIFREDLMAQIESIFLSRGYSMSENNRKQAFIPEGAIPIPNEIGTAPGFIIEKGSSVMIALPGVPKELQYLAHKYVLPYLKEHFHLHKESITSKVLRITGLGESKVDSQIKDLINPHVNPRVGILASPGDIQVTITASAKDPGEADQRINTVEQEIRSRLGIAIYGTNNDTLEEVVTDLLNEKGDTLGVIETFSGGELTARLQKIALSPLLKSIVIGEREQVRLVAKQSSPFQITNETAKLLADKIKEEANSSIGLALVGILRKHEKLFEVDAHIVVSGDKINRSFRCKLGGDLSTLQMRGAIIALNTLRMALISP